MKNESKKITEGRIIHEAHGVRCVLANQKATNGERMTAMRARAYWAGLAPADRQWHIQQAEQFRRVKPLGIREQTLVSEYLAESVRFHAVTN